MISKQFFHTLQARVRQAEQATDAELVTVLAPASDGYRYIPTLWAALLAMLTPAGLPARLLAWLVRDPAGAVVGLVCY